MVHPDPRKLTAEQRDRLDVWNQNKQIIRNLEDVASIAQDISQNIDKWQKGGDKSSKSVGALLTDIREAINKIASKEAPRMPDYAKPVVDAVSDLKTTLEASIKAIDVKPKVDVNAPNVNVKAPDLSKIEKVIKTVPDAFNDAIKKIPKTEIPESDYTPLLEVMTELSSKLDSIDTGVRLKPQQKVYATNSSNQLEVDIAGGVLTPGTDFDHLSITNSDTDEDTLTFKTGGSGGTTVQTIVVTYASGAAKASDDLSALDWS